MKRPSLGTLVRGAVAVALLCVVILVIDLSELARILAEVDPGLLAVALLLAFVDRIIMAVKWLPLARILVPSLRLATAIRAYFASTLAGFLLPASVGGDVLRTVGVGRTMEGETAQIGASVVLERMLGLVASGFLSLVALIIAIGLGLELRVLLPWAAVAFLVPTIATILTLHPRFTTTLERLGDRIPFTDVREFTRKVAGAYTHYKGHGRLISVVGVASVGEQLIPVVILSVLASALEIPVTLMMLLVAQPLSAFVSRLPISIWSIGVSETAFIVLLAHFGIRPAEAVALTVAGRFVEVVTVAPGALFWRELVGRPDSTATDRPERVGSRE